MSIDFKLGPARVAPYRTVDRVAPSGTSIDRPFDVRHTWKQNAGRSTGGGYALTNFDAMDWVYSLGVESMYERLMALYTPQAPWVWAQIYDVYTNAPAWFEAVMLEPKVSRGVGITVNNVSVSFVQVVPYV
jgi:hypothetical protein